MDEKDFITQQPAPDAGEPGSSSPSDAPVTAPVVADSAAEPVTECSAEGADGTAAEGVASPAAKQSVGVKFVGFLKYLFGINLKGYVVPGGEKFSYYFYFTGQNVIYSLVAYNLMTFLLLQGVDPALSATVLICVKVWDAINDAVFGTIFDKVKFKSGNKFVPWLRISVALIPIATILLFCLPADISGGGKLAWLAVFYVLWDTAYTLCDAPLYGSITVLTGNLGERDKMLSVKGILPRRARTRLPRGHDSAERSRGVELCRHSRGAGHHRVCHHAPLLHQGQGTRLQPAARAILHHTEDA